jgi:ABC-type uncharacterized transport system YnjBCD substrate-binding protein
MTDIQRDAFGPAFARANPGTTLNIVSTGPGDAGSAAIHARLKALSAAGGGKWDMDVAVVHQSAMEALLKDGLLQRYTPGSPVAASLVSSDAKNALGTDVDGYVVPMFHSQVAIAYNPRFVSRPPGTYQEIVDFARANPGRFGYNGIKDGMSGVGFTVGYVYWRTGQYQALTRGPYDAGLESAWPPIFQDLRAFNQMCNITAGNVETLELLNRGEIWMGPVWVDMLVLWKNEGRIDPNLGVFLPEPGLPGQPMYLVVPREATHKAEAIRFVEMIASPEIQAAAIVEWNGWYPGIDPALVLPRVSRTAQGRVFSGVSAEDLSQKGLVFPLPAYLKDIQDAYTQAMR